VDPWRPQTPHSDDAPDREDILCLCSLHVDTSKESTSTKCGGGEPGAREARSMLLGERAMAEAVGWVGGIALSVLADSWWKKKHSSVDF
jgi:hypothetical protein